MPCPGTKRGQRMKQKKNLRLKSSIKMVADEKKKHKARKK